ncbi:hypothetical protein LCGC14_2375870 [marine sediment metagenome]|uniref:Uncharacterized protein n=1 Tax=marine sediment metagenome TaxID=412755 RepID=A0A0F9EEU0_9ZZZZ
MREKPDQSTSVPWWYKLSWLLSDWLQKVLIGVGWLILLLVRPGRAIGLLVSEKRNRQPLDAEEEA